MTPFGMGLSVTARPVPPRSLRRRSGRARTRPKATLSEQSLLAMLDEADVVAEHEDGAGVFLLVNVRRDLFDWLIAFGSDREDLEDGDADEDDDPREDDDPDTSVDDEGERPDGCTVGRLSWPPTKAEMQSAIAAGGTVRALARRYGKSQTRVWTLAKRLGVRWASRKKRAPSSPPPPAPTRTWPASAAEIADLVAQGIGDRRAATLFGVHSSTYRARRRKLFPVDRIDAQQPDVDPADYGYAGAIWPKGITFTDCPEAARADRTGRVLRPVTVLERESAIAAC